MDKKLLSKIEKLLSLGKGTGYVGESETALAKAYELMKLHNITMDQVNAQSREDILGPMGKDSVTEQKRQFRKWEIRILLAVTELFDCKIIRATSGSPKVRKSDIIILGREGNRTTAKLMYDWIQKRTVKESKELKGLANRTAYCEGVANGILKKVNSLTAEAPDTDQWGIVPLDEVEAFMNSEFKFSKTTKLSCKIREDNWGSYSKGMSVGENTSLNRQFGLTGIGYRG